MNLGRHVVTTLGVAAVIVAARLATPTAARQEAPRDVAPGVDAAAAPLVQPQDLQYVGAFRVPAGPIGSSSFDYGGTALAFEPEGGSLFVVGHDWHQQVAEIAVPAIRKGVQVGDLAVATVRQPFADVTDGRLGAVGENTVKIGGLLVYQRQLHATAYLYYDGPGAQRLSHFVSGLDLAVRGDARGPFRVGKLMAGYVSGYFGLVPAAWHTALGGPVLNGQCCLGIISRTSYGPSVSTIDPATIGVVNPAPANPLLYYTADRPLLEEGQKGDGWSNTSTLFNGTTAVRGVVFPEATRSVLFFGRQGVGQFCYGPGTADKSLVGKPADGGIDRWCEDPTDGNKGTHAYPYAYYVWGYDALDLSAVKSGSRRPWTVRPYAVWKLTLPFGTENAHINGAAYDQKTGRIFLSQAFGDGDRPVIHVLTARR